MIRFFRFWGGFFRFLVHWYFLKALTKSTGALWEQVRAEVPPLDRAEGDRLFMVLRWSLESRDLYAVAHACEALRQHMDKVLVDAGVPLELGP